MEKNIHKVRLFCLVFFISLISAPCYSKEIVSARHMAIGMLYGNKELLSISAHTLLTKYIPVVSTPFTVLLNQPWYGSQNWWFKDVFVEQRKEKEEIEENKQRIDRITTSLDKRLEPSKVEFISDTKLRESIFILAQSEFELSPPHDEEQRDKVAKAKAILEEYDRTGGKATIADEDNDEDIGGITDTTINLAPDTTNVCKSCFSGYMRSLIGGAGATDTDQNDRPSTENAPPSLVEYVIKHLGPTESFKMIADNGGPISILIKLLSDKKKEISERPLVSEESIKRIHTVELYEWFMYAYVKCHVEIIGFLLKEMDIYNALMRAIQKDHTLIFRELLIWLDNINASDNNGNTLLQTAANKCNTQMVKMLLDKDAEVNQSDLYGYTPLMNAVLKGNKEIAIMLIRYGADVDVRTNNGHTSLMFAARQGYIPMVRMLLAYRANTNIVANDGSTAYDLAMANGHTEVANILANNMAAR